MFINFRVSFNVFWETARPFRQIPNFLNQEQPQMEEESRKEAEEPSCRIFHHFWRGFQMVPRTFVFILVATNLVVDGSRWYYTIPLQYHYHTFYFIHTSYPALRISWRFSQESCDPTSPEMRTWDEIIHFWWDFAFSINHPAIRGTPMTSRKPKTPRDLFWRDSSHFFTFLPFGFLEGCQFLAVGCC